MTATHTHNSPYPTGINLSFTALLLSRGCNVVLADLALRPEAQELVAAHSGPGRSPRAVFVRTDVTSWPSLTRLFDAALAEFDDFDVVCPGAGAYEPHWSNFWHPPGSRESGDAVDGEPGRYALLDINLTHPIRATQLAISHWLYPPPPPPPSGPSSPTTTRTRRAKVSPSNPKRVVHISSVAGQMPNLNAPVYSASKFAVTGFVRSLAGLEDKLGVRVNAVAPGIVRTPLWLEHPEKLVSIEPERDGWVTPDECAVAMLRCVEEDGMIGGTVLEVGRGRTRRVENVNDPGPSLDPRDGLVSGRLEDGNDMVWGWLGDESMWAPPRQ